MSLALKNNQESLEVTEKFLDILESHAILTPVAKQ